MKDLIANLEDLTWIDDVVPSGQMSFTASQSVDVAIEIRNTMFERKRRGELIPIHNRRLSDKQAKFFEHPANGLFKKALRKTTDHPAGGLFVEGCTNVFVNVAVVEPYNLKGYHWEKTEEAIEKFNWHQKFRVPRNRLIRVYDEPSNILAVNGVSPCGKCPMCTMRKRSIAGSNISLEVDWALERGLPVTFMTFTLDSRKVHDTRRKRQGEILGGVFERDRVPAQELAYLVRQQLNKYKRKGGVSIGAIEPHKNGIPHGHALVIGFDPVLSFGGTSDRNKHGNPSWEFEAGERNHWKHGRFQVVKLLNPEHAVKTAQYLGNYISKSAEMDPLLKAIREPIDGEFWDKSGLIWPRPAVGMRPLESFVNENTEELLRHGWETMRDNPLDPHRKLYVQNKLQEITGGQITPSTGAGASLDRAIMNVQTSKRIMEAEQIHG